jgi:hypothetical protein
MKSPALSWPEWIFILLLTLVSQASSATFTVQDSNLQACLQSLADKNAWVQAQDVIAIECHGKGIQSLRGLEQFTGLASLSLYNNRIERLDTDLKLFKNLKLLNLARNNLRQLTIIDLPKLNILYLFDNHLTALALSNLTQLELMKANNNKIEHFSYSNTPQLKKIYIFNNQLESIDIYNLPSLHYMDCRQNPMPDSLYDEMDKIDDVTFLHDGNAEDW